VVVVVSAPLVPTEATEGRRMIWTPTLDEDTSQRADGEQWRASYTDEGGTVYVEACKVDGCVWIAPLGSAPPGSALYEPRAWLRLP
jgi:hypothetical protein